MWNNAISWKTRIVVATISTIAAVMMIFQFHPPMALATLAAVQTVTHGVFGTNAKPQLCSIPAVYRGANQRMSWNALSEKARAEGRLLETKGDFEYWETPFGNWWIPLDNWHALPIILGQMEAGFYAPEGTAVCDEGDVVLDCGAHVGTYARQALRDGARLVVAIEPSPKNLVALRRNLATEIADGRVIVAPVGVWDKEEMLPIFTRDDHTAADSFLETGGKPSSILPLTTIDILVSDLGLERVDVIKMDIKGATAKAIQGARAVIKRDKPMIALATEEGDDVDNPHELTDSLLELHADYESQCGDCSLMQGRPRPNLLTFR